MSCSKFLCFSPFCDDGVDAKLGVVR
ncbi:MAG: hypothetical protein K0Q67_3192, partial [Cellvibrio sp.]|nr:hypothetical protein [Cellvibrio sp.]